MQRNGTLEEEFSPNKLGLAHFSQQKAHWMEFVTLSIWKYDQREVAYHILTKFIPQHPNFIDTFNFEVVSNRF